MKTRSLFFLAQGADSAQNVPGSPFGGLFFSHGRFFGVSRVGNIFQTELSAYGNDRYNQFSSEIHNKGLENPVRVQAEFGCGLKTIGLAIMIMSVFVDGESDFGFFGGIDGGRHGQKC